MALDLPDIYWATIVCNDTTIHDWLYEHVGAETSAPNFYPEVTGDHYRLYKWGKDWVIDYKVVTIENPESPNFHNGVVAQMMWKPYITVSKYHIHFVNEYDEIQFKLRWL